MNPHNKKYYFEDANSENKGVYLMVIDDNLYIGSTSRRFRDRWCDWITELSLFSNKLNSSFSQLLLSIFPVCNISNNKHKENIYKKVKFSVLEVVKDESQLLKREQYWIELLKPTLNCNRPIAPEYYYKLKQKTEKKLSRKKALPKKLISNRRNYINKYIVPIMRTLNKIDPQNFKEGKWHLKYKNKIFKFNKLSSFCKETSINKRVMESITNNRFDYRIPITLVNTKKRI